MNVAKNNVRCPVIPAEALSCDIFLDLPVLVRAVQRQANITASNMTIPYKAAKMERAADLSMLN
jgi:hypothetical protein